MSDHTSLWTEVGGHRLYARVWKQSGDGPAVVLVHGLIVSSRYMMPLGRALADSDCSVYAIDLPGFGRSTKPGKLPTTEGLGEFVAGWVEANDLRDVTLVANSYGSQVAVEAALLVRDRLASLILMGATVDSEAPYPTRQACRLVRTIPREPWWFLPVAFRDLLDCGLRAAFASVRNMSSHDMLAVAARVTVPTTIIRGSHDAVSPQRWADRLASTMNTPQVIVVPGGAHIVHGRKHVEVARVIDTVMQNRTQCSR